MNLRAICSLLFAFLIVMPSSAIAQGEGATPQAAAAAQPQPPQFKSEELEALVAPVALYPDTLLALVLMASTYPLEVVQADRWAKENKQLKGDALKTAADKQAWDNSVKSLVPTPDVLAMMSTKLDWTQKLGDAVLAQQADVMDAIQRMRSKAHANKKLNSTKEQKVTVKQEQNKQVIVIEPTEPNTIYVPYYNPAVVYGAWPYPAYPPYYFGYPGYIAAGVVATGLAFGAGYALGRWASGGNYWGGGCNWGGNNININRPVNINNIGNNWQHNSAHRHGVKYSNANVAQKFGGNRAGSEGRMDFRGRGGDQVLRPGSDRPGGDRPGAGDRDRPGGDRAGAGRPETRPSAGDRSKAGGKQGAGDRPSAGDRSKGGGKQAAAGNRPSAGDRGGRGAGGGGGGGGLQRDGAFGNVGSGRAANLHSARGQASLGGGGFGGGRGGGGGFSGGGGGFRGGGGGGFGGGRGGGGGRRSDVALKHDILLLGRLDNGIGFYRFAYHGSDRSYVGVMAQEVQSVMPAAVMRGRDGYLRVAYDKLGVRFQTYDRWIATGAQVPRGPAQTGDGRW
jgi:hypothetical protein